MNLRSKKEKDEPAQLSPVPGETFEPTRRRYFQIGAASVVEANRWFIFCLVLAAIAVASVIAVAALAPLKTVELHVVKVDESGRTEIAPAASQRYVPGENELRYFLKEWVVQMYTIDPALTRNYLNRAYGFCADKACQMFEEWVAKEEPLAVIARTPGLIRSVAVNTVAFVPNNVAMIRFVAETRVAAREQPRRQRLLMTVNYRIVPPTTPEEIFRNPLGLYVTHFTINEEQVR